MGRSQGWFAMKAVADTLAVARSSLVEQVSRCALSHKRYRRAGDDELLALIRRHARDHQRRDQSIRFFNALLTVAANRTGNVISNERLGRWLKANEGKMTNGLSIVRAGSVDG
jgi:hypothetical protein